MSHTASCSCGALKVTATGAPAAIVACHCLACQRRSGSPFGVGAYFPESQVTISGESKTFTRTSDSGNPLTNHFCPTCGSSVYWFTVRSPGTVGIALGAFGDPLFPVPMRSIWEQSMHPWVAVQGVAKHHPRGRDS